MGEGEVKSVRKESEKGRNFMGVVDIRRAGDELQLFGEKIG